MLIILAWRNLWRKKRRTFITISSVMFAAFLAIALMSMMDGMRDQMVSSIISSTTGYIQIQDALYHDEPILDHTMELTDEISDLVSQFSDRIAFTVPRINGFCLGSKDMGSRGVYVTGILPEKEEKMNALSSRVTEGRMFSAEDDYAVIAAGLARQLDLALGDTLVLLGQGFQGATAAGTYQVGGIIEFLMPEQNNTMVYLPLKEAQLFFGAPDRLNSLIIMVDSESDTEGLAADLANRLDPEWHAVKTWEELLPDQVAAFEARDAQVRLMAWILYVVVGFGILGTIITMMHERLREFGILLSIGLKRTQLAMICMLETIMISFLGVLAGIGLGFMATSWFKHHPIQLEGAFAEVFIELNVEPIYKFSNAPDIFIYQGTTIFIIALVVGIYPIRKILRLDMINAARK